MAQCFIVLTTLEENPSLIASTQPFTTIALGYPLPSLCLHRHLYSPRYMIKYMLIVKNKNRTGKKYYYVAHPVVKSINTQSKINTLLIL